MKEHPVRRLWIAWAALVALMLASLASAYVPLGVGNLVIGVAIACVKASIVAAVFMRLVRASAVVRIAAAAGLAAWLLLASLTAFELMTRPRDAVPVQPAAPSS